MDRIATLADQLLRLQLMAVNHRAAEVDPGEEAMLVSAFQYVVRSALKDEVGAVDLTLPPLVIAALPAPDALGNFSSKNRADLVEFLRELLTAA